MVELKLPENIEFTPEMASESGRILSDIVEMDLWEGDSMLADGLSAAGVPDGLVSGYASSIVTAVKETREKFPEQSPFLTGYGVGLAVAQEAAKKLAKDIVDSEGYALLSVDDEILVSDANTGPIEIGEYLGGLSVAAGMEYTPLTEEELDSFGKALGEAYLDIEAAKESIDG